MQVKTSGWTAFSGVMLILAGTFGIFDGLVAIFQDDAYLVSDKAVIAFDFTAWGWIHLLVGILVVAAGAAVMNGAIWARAIGITAAFCHAIITLGFITVYPWWTLLIITIDVLVIYGLMVGVGEEVGAEE